MIKGHEITFKFGQLQRQWEYDGKKGSAASTILWSQQDDPEGQYDDTELSSKLNSIILTHIEADMQSYSTSFDNFSSRDLDK